MTFPADIPDDIDALKAMLVAVEAQINVQNETLTERDGIIERKEDRIIRLEKLLADFKRALYGAKSEKGHLLPDRRLHSNLPRGRISTILHWKTSRRLWQSFTPRTKPLIRQSQRRQSPALAVVSCQSTCRALKK